LNERYDQIAKRVITWLPWHLLLVALAVIVLMPIIYLFAAGFRSNQAIYGPFIDTNTWVDVRIADRKISRISKKDLNQRINAIFAGYSNDEINAEKFIAKQEKIDMVPDELQKALKLWINSNDKPTERESFIKAVNLFLESMDRSKGSVISSQIFHEHDGSLLYEYERRFTLQNYLFFFSGKINQNSDMRYPIFRWFLNSLFIATTVSLVQAVVVVLAAYVISRFRFFGRRAGMLIILTLQIFPSAMSMVALFLLLTWIGRVFPPLGIDRKIGLILVYLGIGIPLNIWIAKGYFDTIPRSIEESAIIDGATGWQVFVHIFVPLLRPVIAVLIILSFVAAYNEFLFALVLITNEDNYTLPVALSGFMWSREEHFFGIFAAASCIGSLPIVVLWLLLQKQIIAGLTRGAIR
jgi:ABC-type maltose transport system permease subunit